MGRGGGIKIVMLKDHTHIILTNIMNIHIILFLILSVEYATVLNHFSISFQISF